jgi:hypothetical protein
MPNVELSEFEYELIQKLRKEAERITEGLSEAEKADVLSSLYAWRNDKIVTQTESYNHG